MQEKLFIYGTLAPGGFQEGLLKKIGGNFQKAVVKGRYYPEGYGVVGAYPLIILDEDGEDVEGYIFSSENLAQHWQEIDEYEGEGYRREKTFAKIEDGCEEEVYIYTYFE